MGKKYYKDEENNGKSLNCEHKGQQAVKWDKIIEGKPESVKEQRDKGRLTGEGKQKVWENFVKENSRRVRPGGRLR